MGYHENKEKKRSGVFDPTRKRSGVFDPTTIRKNKRKNNKYRGSKSNKEYKRMYKRRMYKRRIINNISRRGCNDIISIISDSLISNSTRKKSIRSRSKARGTIMVRLAWISTDSRRWDKVDVKVCMGK